MSRLTQSQIIRYLPKDTDNDTMSEIFKYIYITLETMMI